MDDAQEQDQYEERLKEVFNSFDASGTGSLSPEELSDLCQSLHLGDATPALLQALIQNEDHLTGRVDFHQFKNALIAVLSSSIEAPQPQQEEDLPKPDSPVIQPKFVKGSKRYGRRSTPEFIEPVSDFTEVTNVNPVQGEEDPEEDYSAVPRKKERWNAVETNTEEYEAEGQMHLWNPDDPSTPRGSIVPVSEQLEGRIREACDKLALSWDGCASHNELLGLCDHLGLEVTVDVLQSLSGDGAMTVQEFVTRVVSHSTPLTPSASTSYRQFKRLHSTQPFDEVGRRTVTPSAMTGTIGMRLFSTLDDGTGYIPVEYILDAWMEEGIENSTEILQALDFSLDGKLNLCELTMALENELLVTKNGIHQAALASFKAEIRHLLERVDRELREKEKIRSDLEKAEKLKSQLAAEVDEHHSAIERTNNLNIRKLEQDHKEKVLAVRSELIKEMDQIQQQAGLQREELEAELEKIRGDETFLRDHLSIAVKENRRVEMELLDSTEKLVEAQNQMAKLQEHLDKIVKEKFGDLDPGSADYLLQEERIKQLRSSYEAQCRELQDRIDELQSELQEFHSLGRVPQLCSKPLSEELESKSPGMESDPGLGSEDGQPFNMTLEAELMLEHVKEQHLREVEDLRAQLESKVNEFDLMVQEQRAAHEKQKAAVTLRYQEEVRALKEEISGIQNHEQELRKQLDLMEQERANIEQKQAGEREELESLQAEEVAKLSQRLLEAHTHITDLEEQLKSLEFHQAETEVNMDTEIERLKERHALALNRTDEEHEELLKATLEEHRTKLLEERANVQARLLEDWEREKEQLQQSHEEELKVRLEEVSVRFQGEREELQRRLTEEWEKEKGQMKDQSNEALQTELEEGIQRLLKEQEEKERKLKEEWETELAELQEAHEDMMRTRLTEERLKQEQREGVLREEWEGEKLQLEESYERMLQDQLKKEREKLEAERKGAERRLEEEKAHLQESHRVAMRELTTKHSEERERLGGMLDQLREDIAVERRELENHFTKKIKDVEDRFSGEQESVTERFQADVLKLEQHYQTELKTLSENHTKQKHKWETEMEMALHEAAQQKTLMREAMEQEREAASQERAKEQEEQERSHKKEMEALVTRNKELQNELDNLVSSTQTKEIELSRHLNDLHNRLQDSLKTKDELLAQSDSKALEAELLLNQAVEDFKQERAELQMSLSELNAKYKEAISISEKQIEEGIDLLTERDDLKMKIEELERLLKQAAEDFDLERQELLENISILEDKLMDNLSCCEMQENERVGLIAERDLLSIKVKKIECELNKYLSTASESAENQGQDEDTEMTTDAPDLIKEGPENTDCAEEQSENEACSGGGTAGDEQAWESCFGTRIEAKHPNEPSDGHVPQDTVPENHNVDAEDEQHVVENKDNGRSSKVLPQVLQNENAGEDVVDCENPVAHESCDEDNKPQEGPAEEDECPSHNVEPYIETAVESSAPEATLDPDRLIYQENAKMENAKMNCLAGNSDDQGIEIELLGEELRDSSEAADEQNNYSPESLEPQNHNDPCEQLACSLGTLQALYSNAIEENILLYQKTDLLQQKTNTLENILAHSGEKIEAGNHALEENYNLKVKMLLIMEQTKELEIKALRMAAMQLKYEVSVQENDKLKEQNCELEEKVLDLESRMHIVHEFQDQQIALVNEIAMVREENSKLSVLVTELEGHNEILMALPQDPESRSSETSADDSQHDLNCHMEAKIQVVADLEDCCVEFEKQNGKLRSALTELQGKSLTLTERMQAHSTETNRLAEENHVLQHKIATLKEEDLREAYRDLKQKLERLKKEKMSAQKMAETFKKQISGLYLRSQQLEEENAQKAARVETLSQQLAVLIKETERRECVPAEERTQMSACVSALEADLTKALEDTVHLEGRNSQLTQQLCALREKVQTVDESVQLVNLQNARLKSDLRAIQQEKETLRQEVLSLHKQLQNANDKNHVLEMTLNSSGFQSQHKKLFREKISRLQEQEQQLLKQENERLQVEVCNTKGELDHSRDKVRQLEASIVSLKQQKQKVKALEQENAALKKEMEDKKELTKFLCENGENNVERLQQENEALKAQMAHLSSQLLETLQSQFVGMLPPSPHRVPRGQHRGDDDNMQGGERKMRNMEERLKEIELSLHNVKLLLKEKVVQLKDQLHKNSKADVLIKDLYVENDHLLKTLDMTEQRHKIAVKKNYLLEEKISSLNKILRDLNPSPLPTTPYY